MEPIFVPTKNIHSVCFKKRVRPEITDRTAIQGRPIQISPVMKVKVTHKPNNNNIQAQPRKQEPPKPSVLVFVPRK